MFPWQPTPASSKPEGSVTCSKVCSPNFKPLHTQANPLNNSKNGSQVEWRVLLSPTSKRGLLGGLIFPPSKGYHLSLRQGGYLQPLPWAHQTSWVMRYPDCCSISDLLMQAPHLAVGGLEAPLCFHKPKEICPYLFTLFFNMWVGFWIFTYLYMMKWQNKVIYYSFPHIAT